MTVERVFLPSRIRRGRTATTPVWRAEHGGRALEFQRKRDATRYELEGCPDHKPSFCPCGGREFGERKWVSELRRILGE